MKVMKYMFILFCMSMISCKSTQETQSFVQKEEIANDGKVTGIIKITDKGCSPIIEAEENGVSVKMYPVNLPEDVMKSGIKIKFNYLPSRAPQPDACVMELKVVSVENVEMIE